MELKKNQFIVMATMSFALLIVFFHRFSLGVVADDITRSLQLTAASYSSIGAVYFYVYGFMQLPVGFLVDSLGPRKITSAGMIFAGLGSFLFAAASSFPLAFLGRLLVSLGVSVVFISILKIQTLWFHPRQFSSLSGLTSAMGNLGGVLAAAPLALVVVNFGWRSSFQLMGILSIVIGFLIFLIVRDRPSERGLAPVNPVTRQADVSLVGALKQIVLNRDTWPPVIAFSGLMGSTLTLAGVWGVTYLMQVPGFSKAVASQLISFITLGFLVGSPLFGYLGSRLNQAKRIINIGSAIALIPWFFILYYPNIGPLAWGILLFMLGFFSITFILSFTNVKEVNEPAFAGMATSLVNFIAFTSSAVISIVVGRVLAARWDQTVVDGLPVYSFDDFQPAMMVIFLFFLAGVIGSWFFKESRQEMITKLQPVTK